MSATTVLADQFEEHRTHLKAVGYRLLGSLPDAEDAVQEAWLRLSRSNAGEIENLGGWLTTVVSRICLDMLRSREARSEERLDTHLPDPIVTGAGGIVTGAGGMVTGAGGSCPEDEAIRPTRWAWPCRWCSTGSSPPSGLPSCCTTCSAFPSRTLPSLPDAPPTRSVSSPAAPAAG